ncbi:hypothetical protein BN1723_020701, partial [Verticillium longisporum]
MVSSRRPLFAPPFLPVPARIPLRAPTTLGPRQATAHPVPAPRACSMSARSVTSTPGEFARRTLRSHGSRRRTPRRNGSP